MKKIISVLLASCILMAILPSQTYAYKYYSNRDNIQTETVLEAITYQSYHTSMTTNQAQDYIKDFIDNTSTYIKVPNIGDYASVAQDAVYTTDLNWSSKGCFHYAEFIQKTMYGTAGLRKYSDESGGDYTANGIKSFLEKEAQAGEHLRLGSTHSLSFIASRDSGIYTLQWSGDMNDPYLSFISYEDLASTANIIGEYYLFNSDTAINGDTDSHLSGEHERVFTDIEENWAKGYIEYLIDEGVSNGYQEEDGTFTFRQKENITRAELARMINNVAGLSEEGDLDFTDVAAGSWYEKDVAIAVEAGYINGYPGEDGTFTFKPNQNVTRQETAKMIAMAFSIEETEETANFKDGNEIQGWAAPNINALAKAGILDGYNDGTFRPHNSLTREEAAKILVTALDIDLD